MRLVFFIFPYSEIKNGLQDYFAQTKTKTQKEKIFFPKYTPGVWFLSGHTHRVYCPRLAEQTQQVYCPPPSIAGPRTGARAVVCAIICCCKKSLCKLTKNNNKKISRNLLTNLCLCAIIQIQTKERGTQQCMLTPLSSSSGLSPLSYLLLFPC